MNSDELLYNMLYYVPTGSMMTLYNLRTNEEREHVSKRGLTFEIEQCIMIMNNFNPRVINNKLFVQLKEIYGVHVDHFYARYLNFMVKDINLNWFVHPEKESPWLIGIPNSYIQIQNKTVVNKIRKVSVT